MVVGGLCVGGNREKLMKKHNKLQFGFDVIDDVTFMSHISSESPSSEDMVQCFFLTIRPRGGARERFEKFSENGVFAPPSG